MVEWRMHACRGWIVRYFRSGWTFLVPYTGIYVLYALGIGPTKGTAGSLPLLYVYWALHVLHCILALFVWWSRPPSHPAESSTPIKLRSCVAWVALFCTLCIAGVYLEWPSDPWEHRARIEAWSSVSSVAEHPTPSKSSYLLTYSVVAVFSSAHANAVFSIYQAGLTLLLGYQYLRLGRAVGLRPSFAFVFVVVQVFSLGNSSFAFFRYYGLSSTIVAQIAAIALIRIAVEWAESRTRTSKRWAALTVGLLCMIAVMNHVQALGIALLGWVGIALCVAFRRGIAWGASLVALILAFVCGTAFLAPGGFAVAQTLEAHGWLHPLYGFAIGIPGTPAFDRMVSILGVVGVLSVAFAFLLVRKNHVSAWLTLTPPAALVLPLAAIPFGSAVALRGDPLELIITYHRMFFAVPLGLSLLVLVQRYLSAGAIAPVDGINRLHGALARRIASSAGPLSGMAVLLTVLILPPSSPYFTRLWHSWARPPNDLAFSQEFDVNRMAPLPSKTLLITNPNFGFVLFAQGCTNVAHATRLLVTPGGRSPSQTAEWLIHNIRYFAGGGHGQVCIIVPDALASISPHSQAALLSQHWLPQEAALRSCGSPEARESLQHLASTNRAENANESNYILGD